MTETRKHLTGLVNGEVSNDGKWILLDMQFKKSDAIPVLLSLKGAQRIVPYLVGIAQMAENKKPKQQRLADVPKHAVEATLIEALGVSFGPGRTQDEFLMFVHLGEFGLGFALPRSIATELQEALADMVSSQPIRPQ